MSKGRYTELGENYGCLDCGILVFDVSVHDRFHAILNHHGKAIALTVNAHIAPHTHDKYDLYEKVGKPEDSWSGDAFKEVTGLEPN